MKKNKKIRSSKSRLAIFALALVLPLCTSGLAYSLAPLSAQADTVASYSAGHIEEVSVSNNNFSSSSSSYSLSTSLTGWTGKSGTGTTAGAISTGSTFNSYMSSTFYLSSNPGTASTDNYVLMINSASSTSTEYTQAHQGYTSSDITLDANSYYSFQVSFKSDSSYSSETSYVKAGTTVDENTISTTYFTAKPFTSDASDPEYVSTTIDGGTTYYYVEKTLESTGDYVSATEATGLDILFEDDTYYGFLYNNTYYFVQQSEATKAANDITVGNTATLFTISAGSLARTTDQDLSGLAIFYVDANYVGVEIDGECYLVAADDVTISNDTASIDSGKALLSFTFTSSNSTFTPIYAENLTVFYSTDNDETYVGVSYNGEYVFVLLSDTYDPANADGKIDVLDGAEIFKCKNIEFNGTNYTLASGTDYYTTSTEYTSVTNTTHGSIYLSGLVDENGDEIELQYELISSSEWRTFYFYIATGDTEQTVSLELWLSSKTTKESGVVFFDNVHVYQYSENMFWKDYQNNFGKSYTQTYVSNGTTTGTTKVDQVKFQDLREESEAIAVIDFEDVASDSDSLDKYFSKNWTKTVADANAGAKMFNTSSAAYFKSVTGFDYVGSNLAAYETITDSGVSYVENNNIMALWANDSTVKVTYGESFEIKSNEIIKITVSYKFSGLDDGTAYLYVTENEDVLSTYKNYTYTLTDETANSGVSENGDSSFNNEYATMEIYVQGRALYNSSFSIAIGLGDDSTAATGCIIIDDITIEYATTEDFSDSSDTVSFESRSSSPAFTNGAFNNVQVTDDMPYGAEDWTIESEKDEDENVVSFAGVINTDENRYDAYNALYKECQKDSDTQNENNPYLWALPANPGNPNATNSADASTPNNILMLANCTSTWQKVTSPALTLSADTNYSISFSYKTIRNNSNTAFSITAYTSDDIILFEKSGIYTESTWNEMTIYFQNGFASTDIYLLIEFGTEDENVKGYAYFDNFVLTTLDDDEDLSAQTNVVDMTEFYLNLPTNNITADVTTSETSAYTYTVTSGSESSMMGGLATSDLFTDSQQEDLQAFAIDSTSTEVVFLMQISGQGSSTIKSNFGIDLTADTYYALTFKVKTVFGKDLDDEKEYSHGLTAGLTNFDYATQIRTDDEDSDGEINEDYVTYTLYFCPTEDITTNLYFCLICDSPETYGMVVIYDVSLTSSDDDDSISTAYENAEDAMDAKDYDINSNCVFVGYDEDAEEDADTETDSTDDEETEANYEWMLYLSTIVFGLAIIVAVVGYALRHVRIKKFKKKEKIDYGRESTVDMEIIRQKAREQRDEEIAKVEENLSKFQKELDRLEAEHKENVLKLRENDNGKLTKVTDKEFKEFGQKRTVISEKIDSLKKQIEDMKTPEYLMTIERKVYDLEMAKRKELLKVKQEIGVEETANEAATAKKAKKTTSKDEQTKAEESKKNKKNNKKDNK